MLNVLYRAAEMRPNDVQEVSGLESEDRKWKKLVSHFNFRTWRVKSSPPNHR